MKIGITLMNKQAERLLFSQLRNVRKRVEQNPIKPDIVLAYNAMQIGDFVEQTHVAIEKGLKWAVVKAGGIPGERHSLQGLVQKLGDLDDGPIILDYLRKSFNAVRRFYRIDTSRPEFRHIKTLDSYLNKVGGKKVYDEARYATLNAITKEDFSSGSFSLEGLRHVFPQAHIEILRALEFLKSYDSWQENQSPKENVITRVEREVIHQIIDSVNHYSATMGVDFHEVFGEWSGGVDCYVNALEVAVRNNFKEDSCDGMRNALSHAYEKLSRSEDPAVKYRMDTFRYLAKDSQEPIETINLQQCLCQVNKSKDFFEVCSPSGEHIGFVGAPF